MDYDRCGLNLGDAGWPFVKPWAEYDSAEEFLNVPSVKPPYFSDYTIIVDKSESVNCFTSSGWRAAVSTFAIVIAIIGMLAQVY